MSQAPETAALRKAGAWGAVLTALLGVALWVAPGVGEWLKALSFDALFLIRGSTAVPQVVIVALDEESHSRLGQPPDRLWDRSLHVKLLDTLIAHGARVVVFDVLFAEKWPDPQVDARFAEALKRAAGKAVLAASLPTFEMPGIAGGSQGELQPVELLASAAAWGVVELPQEADGALRRHPEWPDHTSLAAKAAELAGSAGLRLGAAQPERERLGSETGAPRWINYYGPEAFRHVSYWQALQPELLAPDVFSNKVVFVGKSRVITARGGNSGDEYPTPRTRWTGHRLSGVEIQATVFSNLWRRDWLEELPKLGEAALFILCGAFFGFGLALLRPLAAVVWAAAGTLVLGLGALALFGTQRLWFPWLIVAGAQVPVALGWSVLSFVMRASQAKEIPDHTLLRCVGRGGYGEVWLARNAIGGFAAVKIVYRKNFPRPEPFEREFRGMKIFAPMSRSHPGLVHILHVGRNDLRGCFFYIMEAADDEVSGANIEPDRYVPRTLAGEIARRGRLPVEECVELALRLASALDHLHQRQLVHRDIKPSNIIFVGGEPKLADVGLVTGLAGEAGEVTRVGTAGYLAPEGPGTAAADVFALGKTLYEAATGCECGRFPELPTNLSAGADADALLRLHEILLTACETDPADRCPSAAAMRAALLELQIALTA